MGVWVFWREMVCGPVVSRVLVFARVIMRVWRDV
jgi:hypothetical protein